MIRTHIYRHRLGNWFHSVLLILLMAGLLGYLALILAGPDFALMAIAGVILVFWFNPWISPSWLLQLYRARLLQRTEAPQLYQVVDVLAERAGLPKPPQLYYLPNQFLNAFAVGHRGDSAIALSDGLLRRLELYELAGVLGHEISHIRGNDVRVMGLADVSGRITRVLSTVGIFLLLINLPLILFADDHIGWMPILVLLLAPWISDLAQLALSRVREFQADLGSVELLGDSRPLMAALMKMDRLGVSFFERWVLGGRRKEEPSLLRTHPTTRERIARLQRLDSITRGNYPLVEEWLPSATAAWPFLSRNYRLPRWPKDRYLF